MNMGKKLGQDFNALLQEAYADPETSNYLKSFSVIIGDMVYARRMQLNISQADLAKQAGTSQRLISLIETAKGNVGQEILDKVFKELKLTALLPAFDEQAVALA
jgi:ribosome-binding protein aMBF1 (putative translation factor)